MPRIQPAPRSLDLLHLWIHQGYRNSSELLDEECIQAITVYWTAPLPTPSSNPLPDGSQEFAILEPLFGPRLGSALREREPARPLGQRRLVIPLLGPLRSGYQQLALRRSVPQQSGLPPWAPHQLVPPLSESRQSVRLRWAPRQLVPLQSEHPRLGKLH
jgi:hypothetical protein